jgi:protease I
MSTSLSGKRIAILVENGFEEVELTEPKKALERAGAVAPVVSPSKGKVKAWKDKGWGEEIVVDLPLAEARADDFDGLVLPGGVQNPDQLRINPEAVSFVKAFFTAKKPVGAICHGPWTLINAGVVKGRTMTSWPSLRVDLENAGARWVDREVVSDEGLVTSRKPADIPAFNEKIIEAFAGGKSRR